jgi:hypothetical protein
MAAKEQSTNRCGCSVTTNIADQLTWGHGRLDPNGFWEFPCTHSHHDIDVNEFLYDPADNGNQGS